MRSAKPTVESGLLPKLEKTEYIIDPVNLKELVEKSFTDDLCYYTKQIVDKLFADGYDASFINYNIYNDDLYPMINVNTGSSGITFLINRETGLELYEEDYYYNGHNYDNSKYIFGKKTINIKSITSVIEDVIILFKTKGRCVSYHNQPLHIILSENLQ